MSGPLAQDPRAEAPAAGRRVTQRAVLVGSWSALPSEESVLWIESRVLIERCPAEAGPLRQLVRLSWPSWLLVGGGIPDETSSRLVQIGRIVKPDLLVGLLGAADDTANYQRWMRRGVALYLAESADPERVGFALATVATQDVVIIDRTFCPQPAETSAAEARPRVTRRESEVLELIVLGMRNREIATALHLSENTVEAHLRHLFSKLDVRTRAAAVQKAIRGGFV